MLKQLITLFIAIFITMPVIADPLEITHPWSKAVPPTSNVAAAFLSIINHGNADDTLIEAHSPIAEIVELHTLKNDNGLIQMRQVNTINIAAEHTQELAPGGFHLMLFNLIEVPSIDSHFPLTLTFKHAGEITVNVAVKPATYNVQTQKVDHALHHDIQHH